jgi:AAA-like domain/TIR domain
MGMIEIKDWEHVKRIGASKQGLQIIDTARCRKGWTKTSSFIWWNTAKTSRATLRRFWRGIPIERDTFIAICAAVGIQNWQEIVDLTPEPLNPDLEAASRGVTGDANQTTKTISILYSALHPSQNLVQQVYQALQAAGNHPLLIGDDQHQGLTWTQNLNSALQQSDCVVILIDREGAKSEMMTEVVRRAKESDHQPTILPIHVDLPNMRFLNPDLQGYLQPIQPLNWNSPGDTDNLILEMFRSITGDHIDKRTDPEIQPITEVVSTDMMPPLPTAAPELEVPHGQVALASRFYIPRPPKETQAMEIVTQPGALIRIKAPRQMGKTSLMARLLAHAELQGYHKVSLSFQLADAKDFADLDRFLYWFCGSIGRKLKLPNRLADYWDDMFGSKVNCTAYFEEYLLAELDAPLVLGLDEVDRVFQYPAIAADFFGLLRAWHEDGKNREIWQKLNLVVVHSTEVYVPMDLNQSPFNVGFSVELPEFRSQQVEELAERHGLHWHSDQVSQLMEMVDGHPYLVRLAIYYIAQGDFSLKEFLQIAPTESGLYRDHLLRHWLNLDGYPDLAEAMEDVVAASEPLRLDPKLRFKLYSMGLVKFEGDRVKPSCQLYRQYFRNCFGID